IRYRPAERPVLRYEPSAAPVAPTRAVFAKLSRSDADVARAFRVATRVADRLDASGGETRALRPLAAVPEDGVILFPEVSGRPLSELLCRHDGVTWHLQRAGRALRALHSGPASLAGALDGRDFATEVEAVRRASEHICALLPRTGAVITHTLERARSAYDRLGGAHRTSGATRQGAARPATLSSPASRGASVPCVRQPRGQLVPRRAARGASAAGVCRFFPLPSRAREETTHGEPGRAACL